MGPSSEPDDEWYTTENRSMNVGKIQSQTHRHVSLITIDEVSQPYTVFELYTLENNVPMM